MPWTVSSLFYFPYLPPTSSSSFSIVSFTYSFSLLRCQVRLGRGQDEGVPSWSTGFRMLRDEDVLRLFVKRGQGRPDKYVTVYFHYFQSHNYNSTLYDAALSFLCMTIGYIINFFHQILITNKTIFNYFFPFLESIRLVWRWRKGLESTSRLKWSRLLLDFN